MKISRKQALIAGLFTVFAVSTVGLFGQGTLWDRDVLTWQAPTLCVDGSLIAECVVTGYELTTAATAAGPWTLVANLGATVKTHTLTVLPGPHCYRVRANSANGFSAYSNVACANTVKPVVPPAAPTLRTVDDPTVAFRVTLGNANQVKLARIGTVPPGVLCDAAQPILGRYVLKNRFLVALDPGVSKYPLAAVANCG